MMPANELSSGTDWETRIAGWEDRLGRAKMALAVALAVQAISFFLYSYHFRPLYQFNYRLTEDYGPMCANPFTRAPIAEPQIRHRILGPLIAYALGLRGISGEAVLPFAVTIFLYLLYRFVRTWLPPAATIGVLLLLATTPVVITSQTSLGHPDILGFLAILICLMTRAIWPVGPVLFLGMLGDERVAASFPLVVLWHFLLEAPEQRWRRALARILASVVAVAAWLVVFRWIQTEFVAASGTDNHGFFHDVFSGHYFRIQRLFVMLGMYYALRSGWLFPIMLTFAWARRHKAMLAAFWIATCLAFIPGLLIEDISRCVANSWPAVLIALRHLYDRNPIVTRHWLQAAVALNVFTPMYNVYGVFIHPMMPLPLALATAPW